MSGNESVTVESLISKFQQEFPHVEPQVIVSLVTDYYYDEQHGGAECYNTLKPLLETLNAESLADKIRKPSANGASPEERPSFPEPVLYLHQCFPEHSLPILDQKLKAYQGNVDKVIDELLNAQFIRSLSEEDRLASLEGGHMSKKAQKALARKNKKLDDSNEQADLEFLVKVLGSDEDSVRALYYQHSKSVTKVLDAHTPFQSAYVRKNTDNTDTTADNRSVTKKLQNVLHSTAAPDSAIQHSSELYRKAAEMYRRSGGNPLFAGAASYYANEASNTRDEAFIRKVQQQSSEFEEDYHGVPVHIALYCCEQRLSRAQSGQTLKFITGAGDHSAGNVPVIKKAIKKLLISKGVRFDEFRSYFMVPC